MCKALVLTATNVPVSGVVRYTFSSVSAAGAVIARWVVGSADEKLKAATTTNTRSKLDANILIILSVPKTEPTKFPSPNFLRRRPRRQEACESLNVCDLETDRVL